MTASPTPVTVIGGFLGAGKTTLLNRLLVAGGARYAVLVNDFGEINVDAGLIASHDGTTMSLTNGCVCCSIGGGFLETLGGLLDGGQRFDHIVIEASGVGDPWRIAEIAIVEPALRLGRVITVADATRIERLAVDPRVGDTVCNQFAKCDVVLLSKLDLVDETAFANARRAVLSIRPDAAIETTAREVLAKIFEINARQPSGFRADDIEPDAPGHEAEFRRWAYRRDGAFDRTRLAAAVKELPPQLLRLKGNCHIAGETSPMVFQMVDKTWSLSPAAADQEPSAAITLVGVGTSDLPPARDLEAILDIALAASALS
jgi:G3E family GTPase